MEDNRDLGTNAIDSDPNFNFLSKILSNDNEEDEFDMGGFFKRGVDKMLTKMHIGKEKIVDIQNILDSEHNKDENLDFDKWRAELRVNKLFNTKLINLLT